MTTERDQRRVLIVNADDFGLTDATCRSVLELAEVGAITSTSVLAVAPAASRWLAALSSAGIGAGVHLAIVGEDAPLLGAAEIPTLVGRRGHFATSWRSLVALVALGRIDPADVQREWGAQIEAVISAGVAIDHLNTHQHVHLLSPLGEVVARLSAEHGHPAVRVPRTSGRSPTRRVAAALSASLRRRLSREGVPGYSSWGLDGAGHLTEERLIDTLVALSAATDRVVEMAAHPGAVGPDPDRRRYRWGYEWGRETRALRSRRFRAAVDESGFVLGTCAETR